MAQLPGALDSDRYRSIETGPQIETKVKGSSFLGQAFLAPGIADAGQLLARVRKTYHDATHHCSAYRTGPPETAVEKADDDGEPSGTAGTPILGAIHRANLYGAIVIVTRYYGGTKLGTGGLVRAYGDAARQAVEAAPHRTVWRESLIVAHCGYEDIGAVEAVLAREGGELRSVEREFGTEARFTITLLRSQLESLQAILVEATSGRIRTSRGPVES